MFYHTSRRNEITVKMLCNVFKHLLSIPVFIAQHFDRVTMPIPFILKAVENKVMDILVMYPRP